MKKEFELIKSRINKKRLYRTVKDLTAFHRIQASNTYKEAVSYVEGLAKKYHLKCNILEYEANPNVWYKENKMFKEWVIKEATLDLINPDIRLCDFSAEPISVIQKSYPCDYREYPLELIFLDKGDNANDYIEIDFKNKMVFTHSWFSNVEWVFDLGAKGIISDAIREDQNRKRSDLYNSLSYMSFWHKHDDNQKEVFGFVLSPSTGDKLEKLLIERRNNNQEVLVKPYINSELKDGKFEVIEMIIDGEDDDYVLINAHLCHPSSSANDNASGVAASIETMYVINQLIDEGLISKPKHTIKLTLVPEFTGSFAYISNHNTDKLIAAINLDMVGARQDRTNGPITLTKTSLANPSIINEITTYAMSLANIEAMGFGNESLALTNHRIEEFSCGSDHTIYGDPTIGACLMLGQWPDRNYHTSTDTIDKIDMDVLKYSTSIASYFTYIMTNLSVDDIGFITKELIKNMHESFNVAYNRLLNNMIDKRMFDMHINLLNEYYLKTVDNIKKYINISDNELSRIKNYVSNSFGNIKELFDIYDFKDDKHNEVYERLFDGPINKLEDYRSLGYQKELDKFYEDIFALDKTNAYELNTLVPYYIDGYNTLDDIIHNVSAELYKDESEYIIALIDFLKAINLIKLKI